VEFSIPRTSGLIIIAATLSGATVETGIESLNFSQRGYVKKRFVFKQVHFRMNQCCSCYHCMLIWSKIPFSVGSNTYDVTPFVATGIDKTTQKNIHGTFWSLDHNWIAWRTFGFSKQWKDNGTFWSLDHQWMA
jgi:hypothetical protein